MMTYKIGGLNKRLNLLQRATVWLFERFVVSVGDILNIPKDTEAVVRKGDVQLVKRGGFDEKHRWVNYQEGYIFKRETNKSKATKG